MSNDNKSTSSSGGIGFAGLLTIVFITLKLCGVIAWPWVWVLSPLWLGVCAIIGVLLLVFVIITLLSFGAGIGALFLKKFRK